MAITNDDVVAAVNADLQNHAIFGTAEHTFDGETTAVVIAPLGFFVLDDADFAVYLDDVLKTETTHYTMDFDNGTVTMVSTPTDGQVLGVTFNYAYWPDEVVDNAVSASAYSLFPYFYNSVTEDVTLDGEDNEYELDDCEEVVRVMTAISGTNNYTTVSRKKYEILDLDGTKTLRFFTTPTEGTARVVEITRPAVADLPDRALPALVSYACYYLIINKMAPRIRSDVAIATQGSGVLSPRQMADAANAFYMRFQMQLAQTRMRPWSIY